MLNRLFVKYMKWYCCPATHERKYDYTVCRLRKGHRGSHLSAYGLEWDDETSSSSL
mgnify:FL=1|jgi:hypothetical protein